MAANKVTSWGPGWTSTFTFLREALETLHLTQKLLNLDSWRGPYLVLGQDIKDNQI
jgi:hypothetical protein